MKADLAPFEHPCSSLQLTIITSMLETRQIVIQRDELENGDELILVVFFGTSVLPNFWDEEQRKLSFKGLSFTSWEQF